MQSERLTNLLLLLNQARFFLKDAVCLKEGDRNDYTLKMFTKLQK
jgi:hypothetical protein